MPLIAQDEIIKLHKKYAPCEEMYEIVLTHCRIVRDIALQLIEKNGLDVNKEIVEIGALLHDIGAYPLFESTGKLRKDAQYITHGICGERILQTEGLPKNIVRFAAHHTGVGLTKHDIVDQKLPLPIADYLAENDEELLVMYADKFHSKTTPPFFNSYEWYHKEVIKFGDDKSKKFESMTEKFGKPDLSILSKSYHFDIR